MKKPDPIPKSTRSHPLEKTKMRDNKLIDIRLVNILILFMAWHIIIFRSVMREINISIPTTSRLRKGLCLGRVIFPGPPAMSPEGGGTPPPPCDTPRPRPPVALPLTWSRTLLSHFIIYLLLSSLHFFLFSALFASLRFSSLLSSLLFAYLLFSPLLSSSRLYRAKWDSALAWGGGGWGGVGKLLLGNVLWKC